MTRRVSDPGQPSLLEWQPAKVVKRFAAELIRAASLRAKLCRGLKLTLKECGMTRAEVAKGMSDYLGETITPGALNTYVSESMDDRIVNAVRFIAFVAVTGDPRPLNALLEELGLVVIERKYLPWIEVGMLREQQDKLGRDIDSARRRATSGVARD
ncbi:DNA transposition protein [Inquilinus sp. CA228]|uniref:DNA transposition protein n=1 Tax=Inquilinus sp. CA228 TaxID=3455609 RepID=UPI003F8D0AC2